MIVCIEAVKQRNMSGDTYMYLDKRNCAIVFMQEGNVAFAFIVLMLNSKALPTPNSVSTAYTTANR